MKVDMERAMSFVNHLVEIGILDAIHNLEHFYPYSWLKKNDPIFKSYSFADGATKGVFIFEEGVDWVIKFDYNSKHSYCARELFNYKAAKEENLARYFPETIELCHFDDIYFIIQERCDCDEYEIEDVMFNSLKRRYIEWGDEVDDEDIWDEISDIETQTALECLFEDSELCDFASEHRINDLHCANFGKINERIVIIDFSGFGAAVWG